MESSSSIKIAPSILSADFANLEKAVIEASDAGADYIHVDVMDGRFVPKITFGSDMVYALKKKTNVPLDVHLMIAEPERHIQNFVDAGADIITVHTEACSHLHRVVYQIKNKGIKAGVVLNPATPISAVDEVLLDLDLVLIMSVNPGLPAQVFIPGARDKISRIRQRIDLMAPSVELEVDGGINETTAPGVVMAGAQVLVAGSAIFNDKESVSRSMDRLREAIKTV